MPVSFETIWAMCSTRTSAPLEPRSRRQRSVASASALFLSWWLASSSFAAVEALARRRIILLALELPDFGLELLHLGRAGGRAHLHPRGRLVHQVDRLVGQEAPRDVAIRQLGRSDDRFVGDRDLVVRLQRVAKTAQDHDGLLDRRLRHQHGLEAPLERGVLLDVLLVFVERGRADQVEFATRQRRLEHVGDVEAALAAALRRRSCEARR